MMPPSLLGETLYGFAYETGHILNYLTFLADEFSWRLVRLQDNMLLELFYFLI